MKARSILVLSLLIAAQARAQPVPQPGLTKVVHSTAFTGNGTNPSPLDLTHGCSSSETLVWSGSAWACGAGGITNSAGNHVIPVSDGTNLIGSGVTSDTSGNVVVTTLTVDTSGQSVPVTTYFGSGLGLNLWGGVSGSTDTSGAHNASWGIGALGSNIDGNYNSAFGGGDAGPLHNNTSGTENSAGGADAMAFNVSGTENSAWGVDAAQHNIDGNDVLAFGVSAVGGSQHASSIIGIGNNTLVALTASGNVHDIAIGNSSQSVGTTPTNSISVGDSSCLNNSADDVICIGTGAGGGNTSATDEIFIGKSAGILNQDGVYNIDLGFDAGGANVHGIQQLNAGVLAGAHATSNYGINIGVIAGYDVTSGDSDLIIGTGPSGTGRGITTGRADVIIGNAVTGLASGLSNTIIIADGDGNQRIIVNSSGNTTLAGALQLGGTGPTINSGTGVPSINCAVADLFLRTDGGSATTIYYCSATNTWSAAL